MFRNEWVWEFLYGRFPYLGTEARRVLCFVMNGCGDFFTGGFPYLGAGATEVLHIVTNGRCLNGVLNFINYLDNSYKNIKITNLTSNRALCDEIILFKNEFKII